MFLHLFVRCARLFNGIPFRSVAADCRVGLPLPRGVPAPCSRLLNNCRPPRHPGAMVFHVYRILGTLVWGFDDGYQSFCCFTFFRALVPSSWSP